MAPENKTDNKIIPLPAVDITKEYKKLEEEQNPQLKIKNSDMKYSAKQIDSFLSEGECGDAELYIDLFKYKFCYDHIGKDWYYWNKNFWRIDIIGEKFAAIRELRKIYSTARFHAAFEDHKAAKSKNKKKQEDSERQKARIRLLTERINKLGESPYFKRVIETASNGVGSLGIPGDCWDLRNKILVVKNGCIDLVTGKTTEGNPKDYMRTHCPVTLNKKANEKNIKIWTDFLLSSQDGDVEVVRFIQKLIGYSILGTCERHIFPIFYGIHGRNGKSTIFEILKEALGEQMYKLPNDFLIKKKAQKADGAADSVSIGLQGKKIVWCSEIDKGDQIDLPKVKGLTGGDTISARGNWAKHNIHFVPTFITYMITNRLAHVDSSDEAFWQRCFVIPFGLSFVQNPKEDYDREQDPHLKEKLQAILPDIIRWCVQGSLIYQEEGLYPLPAAVVSATKKYRRGQDRLGEFILSHYDECKDGTGFALRSEMYTLYSNWAKESGYGKRGKKAFFDDISRRFGEPVKESVGFGFKKLYKKSEHDIQ